MAKKKFYAVKGSLAPKIYTSWPACQAAVKGVSGVLFKGFPTREEAEDWIGIGDSAVGHSSGESGAPHDGILIYVDGSFSPNAGPYSGWGYVVVEDGEEVFAEYGRTEEAALSRNIDGEIIGSERAIEWCRENGKEATICHDYEGVGRWALGEWKANSEIAKRYQANVKGKLKGIRFKKVAGHSGDKWNDRADELAKKGIGLV